MFKLEKTDEEAKPTARVEDEDLQVEDVVQASTAILSLPDEQVVMQDVCDVVAPVFDQLEVETQLQYVQTHIHL